MAKGSGRVVDVMKGVMVVDLKTVERWARQKLAPASRAVARRILKIARRSVLARMEALRGGRALLPPYLMLTARLGRRVSKRRKSSDGTRNARTRMASVP